LAKVYFGFYVYVYGAHCINIVICRWLSRNRTEIERRWNFLGVCTLKGCVFGSMHTLSAVYVKTEVSFRLSITLLEVRR